eukprot:scpid55465/ scgid22101/ 
MSGFGSQGFGGSRPQQPRSHHSHRGQRQYSGYEEHQQPAHSQHQQMQAQAQAQEARVRKMMQDLRETLDLAVRKCEVADQLEMEEHHPGIKLASKKAQPILEKRRRDGANILDARIAAAETMSSLNDYVIICRSKKAGLKCPEIEKEVESLSQNYLGYLQRYREKMVKLGFDPDYKPAGMAKMHREMAQILGIPGEYGQDDKPFDLEEYYEASGVPDKPLGKEVVGLVTEVFKNVSYVKGREGMYERNPDMQAPPMQDLGSDEVGPAQKEAYQRYVAEMEKPMRDAMQKAAEVELFLEDKLQGEYGISADAVVEHYIREQNLDVPGTHGRLYSTAIAPKVKELVKLQRQIERLQQALQEKTMVQRLLYEGKMPEQSTRPLGQPHRSDMVAAAAAHAGHDTEPMDITGSIKSKVTEFFPGLSRPFL